MPRNKDRFEYVEVSLLKSSKLYQFLSADAEETTQSLAQIMLVRLADYYGMVGGLPTIPSRNIKPGERQEASALPAEKKQTVHQEAEPVLAPTSSSEEEEVPSFDFSGALASAALFDQIG